jgi:chemotaxis protein CheD
MTTGEKLEHVGQGEYMVTSQPGVVLTTILGSCVAACIRDPLANVGGLNHFLLPVGESMERACSLRYGVNAMELLINALLERGAIRSRLEAKLFGGACLLDGLSADIGERNARFAARFLRAEGVACVGHSLGGARARRVRYWPLSGRASLQLLSPRDAPKTFSPIPLESAADVELF